MAALPTRIAPRAPIDESREVTFAVNADAPVIDAAQVAFVKRGRTFLRLTLGDGLTRVDGDSVEVTIPAYGLPPGVYESQYFLFESGRMDIAQEVTIRQTGYRA